MGHYILDILYNAKYYGRGGRMATGEKYKGQEKGRKLLKTEYDASKVHIFGL